VTFPVKKIRPARAAAERDRILPVNCLPGEDILGEGFYNATPAHPAAHTQIE